MIGILQLDQAQPITLAQVPFYADAFFRPIPVGIPTRNRPRGPTLAVATEQDSMVKKAVKKLGNSRPQGGESIGRLAMEAEREDDFDSGYCRDHSKHRPGQRRGWLRPRLPQCAIRRLRRGRLGARRPRLERMPCRGSSPAAVRGRLHLEQAHPGLYPEMTGAARGSANRRGTR
jgi:hypothetical protein